mgnify:CR=1 FL=1
MKMPPINSESYEVLQEQILQECQAMAKHVFASGLKIQPIVIQTIETFALYQEKKKEGMVKPNIQDLVQAHTQLSHIIAPATPRAILLLDKDFAKGMTKFLGPVPLVRSMTLLCLFFLLLFSLVTLCPQMLAEILQEYVFRTINASQLSEYFLVLAAAGMGASFSTLFKANEYILNSTFDKKHESSYWIRFFLGLFSGIILVQFVPIEGAWKTQAKPTLAMLGGFSSLAVYKILSRFVEILETLVPGHKKSNEEQVLKSRLMEQATLIKISQEEEEKNWKNREELLKAKIEVQYSQEKMKIAGRLLELQKSLQRGEKSEILQNLISQTIMDFFPKQPKEEEKISENRVESSIVGEEESKYYPFLQFDEVVPKPDVKIPELHSPQEIAKQLPPVNVRNMREDELLLPLKKNN